MPAASVPSGAEVKHRLGTCMADLRFSRSLSFATAIAATSLCIFGLTTQSFGSATVGETRRVELSQKPPSGVDALKAQYKRPSTIPFPKDDAYTPAKAALGKK